MNHIIYHNKIALVHAVQVVIALLKEPKERREELVNDYCLYLGPSFFTRFDKGDLMSAIGGIMKGNWRMIEEYLARGGWINMPDLFGRSLLYYAIACKRVEFIEELIARGAIDYNQTDRSSPYFNRRDLSIVRYPIEEVKI